MTRFTLSTVRLGDSKKCILGKFGKPFSITLQEDLEVLFYKEVVDVSSYTYILTTKLTFKNSVLMQIDQIEEQIPDKIEISN